MNLNQQRKNREYWAKRFEILENRNNQSANEYYANLEKQYKLAAQNVQKEMDSWFMRYAKENQVSINDARKILTGPELKDFRMTLDEYISKGKTLNYSQEWAKQLEKASSLYHVERYQALLVNIQQQIEVVTGNELDSLDKFLSDQYKTNYYQSAFEIQKGFGVGFDLMKIDDKKVANLIKQPWTLDARTFSDRIWSDKKLLVGNVDKILTQGMISGEGYVKTAKKLQDAMNTQMYKAKRIVVTESAFFTSQSQNDCFKDLGVKKYEIVATLDSKTSEICQRMNQKVFEQKYFKPGVTASPFHPFCRTHQAPHFSEDFGVPEMRAARDAKTGKTVYIDANIKYPEWEKSFVKGIKKDGLDVLKGGIINKTELSKAAKEIADVCDANSVEYKQVKRLNGELMPDEIILKLAGGDKTKGSCASLALAYAGNKSGIDVVDFRGGSSLEVFSRRGNTKKMLEIPGIKGSVTTVKREIKETAALLKTLELNKEYYLGAGKHAAIVRRLESGAEYLELQSANQSGWVPFKNKRYGTVENTLGKRFGCRKTVDKSYGMVWEKEIVLIDVDSFSGNSDFEYLLGYINTAIDSQKKGVGGDVK